MFGRLKWRNIEGLTRNTRGSYAAMQDGIAAVAASFDLKWLNEIYDNTDFYEVQQYAAKKIAALEMCTKKELKEIKKEYKKAQLQKEIVEEKLIKDTNTPGTAAYYVKNGLYEKCTGCGAEAIPLLLDCYMKENDNGTKLIEKALLGFGETAYPFVLSYVKALSEEYISFCGSIAKLNYAHSEDQQKGAVIKRFVDRLSHIFSLLADFNHPNRVQVIHAYYDLIKSKVYSDPENRFGDMFNAVDVRRAAVTAMGKIDFNFDTHLQLAFYEKVLQDPSQYVRWEAIDILHDKIGVQTVKQHNSLVEAIKTAKTLGKPSVSSRLKRIDALCM